MAYGNPSGGGGEMFSDGPMGEAPKETEAPAEGQTAILPKSILAGKDFKPGEEIVLKITAIHDNDVEVEYASEGGKEEQMEPPPQEAAPAPAGAGPMGGGMASMME